MSSTVVPKRVLVYLKTLNSVEAEAQLAKFGECVLSSFSTSGSEAEVKIQCQLSQNQLILSQTPEADSTSVLGLDHSCFCPAMGMNTELRQDLPPDIASRGVSTAVCVMLESADQKMFLTRRAKHMRTFPNVWVPPGGGIELDESLRETGLRELYEEAGLKLESSDIVEEGPLCLWESCFPQTLSRGLPIRHHIVLYHHFRVRQESHELSPKINLDIQETDAYMWLSKETAKIACGKSSSQLKNNRLLNLIPVFECGVGMIDKSEDILTLNLPVDGADVERISTGTKYALEQWIRFV